LRPTPTWPRLPVRRPTHHVFAGSGVGQATDARPGRDWSNVRARTRVSTGYRLRSAERCRPLHAVVHLPRNLDSCSALSIRKGPRLWGEGRGPSSTRTH
jgi:hypothetical protein